MSEQVKKIQWFERYNCHRATLGRGFDLAINWDSSRAKGDTATPPWRAFVFGDCIGNFADFEQAKNKVYEIATERLETALGRLREQA